MTKFYAVLSIFKEKINSFYLLAFVPLLLFAYYHIEWPFTVIIPIYGFILLLFKKPKLLLYRQARSTQKALGLLIVFGSFFFYYALNLFLPSVTFYTAVNYAVFIFGLSLTFFEVSALKEMASSLFLILAGSASSFVSAGLEPYFSPFITPRFAYLINGAMNAFGVKSTIQSADHYSMISFNTLRGETITALFDWYCVGVSSVLIFSIILVVLLIEEHSNLKSRIIWSVIGTLGIWILNVLRVVIILFADYFYGAEVGAMTHYIIGYTIFITWVTVFIYLLSRRTGQNSLSNQTAHAP